MLLDFIESPQVYSNILYITSAFSLPIHIFGGYCILYKTPVIMKSVKWSLFNLHFWSFALDLTLSLFVQPYFCSPAFAGFPLGIVQWEKRIPTDILVIYVLAIFKIVPMTIISMFENRYFVLFVKKGPWRYLRYPFLLFNYTLALALCIPVYLEAPIDQENARRVLFETHSQACKVVVDKTRIFVMNYEENIWPSLRRNALNCFVLAEIIFLGVLLRVEMNRAIKNIQSSISLDTLQKQKIFIRALNLQIAIPIAIIFIPAAIAAVLKMKSSSQQGIDNILNIITSLHGASATILMIYLQKPFRKVFLSIVCRGKQVESKNVTEMIPSRLSS
ncbi:Serpentine Receptor, class H [Caenorhabditis elegans]|uniref:Serpentine Receptor, class H n=1 Tax=Caenorhabditis elegans TaxID=6239 RepID=Q9GRV0_CAEEL|nr:Serpentine Receptor, class H [Caenorhabditis elegans]CAC15863.1 Serpentine Receptor, class H [Caenorhabditis elegans]|eukprot:NP_507502.1 Serpentine Receptor, class H [Caenorhabditis elegans]